MTAPTPTDAEMVAWLEALADLALAKAEYWAFRGIEEISSTHGADAAMLRAIAARLREDGR